jgi:hypothetical protein
MKEHAAAAWHAATAVPGRVLRGRPARLAGRAVLAAGLATAAALITHGTPAAPALQAAAALWTALTTHPELAPPPAR